MATDSNVPTSIRLDEQTKEQLKAFHRLIGESITGIIKRFIAEGLIRESDPDILQRRIDEYEERARRFQSLAPKS